MFLLKNRQKDLPVRAASVKRLASFVLEEMGLSLETTSLAIHLVTEKRIAALHAEFFGDPTPTDCISFPFEEEADLGEIFVCPKVAIDYDPKNPYLEATLYVIHALLHLLGYDDLEPHLRRKMHREQKALLKKAELNRCTLLPP